MSETPEIPIEQVKNSAIEFDLCNLKLEINGTLERFKGDSDALHQLHQILAESLEKCSEAISENNGTKGKDRRIPFD